jgi:hypothetical protein
MLQAQTRLSKQNRASKAQRLLVDQEERASSLLVEHKRRPNLLHRLFQGNPPPPQFLDSRQLKPKKSKSDEKRKQSNKESQEIQSLQENIPSIHQRSNKNCLSSHGNSQYNKYTVSQFVAAIPSQFPSVHPSDSPSKEPSPPPDWTSRYNEYAIAQFRSNSTKSNSIRAAERFFFQGTFFSSHWPFEYNNNYWSTKCHIQHFHGTLRNIRRPWGTLGNLVSR